MKKILGASLAIILAFAAVGCSSSKFKTTRARLKNNAEKTFGASEASKKQKNAMEKDDTELTDSIFKNGCYLSYDGDDAKDQDFNLKALKDGGCTGAFALIKSESESESFMLCQCIELDDKDLAGSVYDEIYDNLVIDSKDIKEAKKNIKDLEYGTDEQEGYMYTVLVLSDSKNMATGVYLKLEDNMVIAVAFKGEVKSDLYEEYLDFMFNSKLQDMEALL